MPMTSNRNSRFISASASVENCGPSMQMYVPRRCTMMASWTQASARTPDTWPQIFFQRTNRAYGDDALHSQQLHRVNVRAVIDLARQDAMPAAVARQNA